FFFFFAAERSVVSSSDFFSSVAFFFFFFFAAARSVTRPDFFSSIFFLDFLAFFFFFFFAAEKSSDLVMPLLVAARAGVSMVETRKPNAAMMAVICFMRCPSGCSYEAGELVDVKPVFSLRAARARCARAAPLLHAFIHTLSGPRFQWFQRKNTRK